MSERSNCPLKVLIVDDQEVLRIGLRVVLTQPDFEILGEGCNGEDAIRLCADLKPDVVLLDLMMPRMNGIEASRLLRQNGETAKIIMLTSMDNEEHIHAALGAGVNGYCLKETPPERLAAGIKVVHEGDFWLDCAVAAKVMRNLTVRTHVSPERTTTQEVHADVMSTDELAILNFIVEGLPSAEIAQRMRLEEAEFKLREIGLLRKLSRSSRVEGAMAALRDTQKGGDACVRMFCRTCTRDFDPHFKWCPYDKADLVEVVGDAMLGCVFGGKYEVLERIGSGGMSVLYKARQRFLNRTVAVKIMSPHLLADVNNARRFREEAEAASRINHPNVIPIFDFGLSERGEPFLVMDYLRGVNLEFVLRHGEAMPVERVLALFIQVCDGLGELHRHGVIHRDVKPSNIMLAEINGQERPCIIDFGIAQMDAARKESQRLTAEGMVIGTPSYLSPEQVQSHPVDARSDVYSLACTMYEALTGCLPFYGDTACETMIKHMSEPAPSMNDKAPELAIPSAIDALVLRNLSKRKEERCQSMDEFKKELEDMLIALPRH